MIIIVESQLYPESLIKEYETKSKGILDYAAHNLCKSILEGLKENNQEVKIVNVPNLGSFPFLYRTPIVKGALLEDGVSVSFLNVSYLKRYDIRIRLKKEIIKQIKTYSKDGEVCLILYNFSCLPIIESLKKRYPQLKVFMIVTDLPEFMLKPKVKFLSFFGKYVVRRKTIDQPHLSNIDGFILLSSAMATKLKISQPWILVEGIYNTDTKVGFEVKEKLKTILYTGNLGLRYGISTLLEAFHRIENSDYQLWICGGGDGLDEVMKYCRVDNRIVYKGILPRAEVLKLQKRATVLINPRNSGDDYTRYSFPSKTMEYLASGTPVIMSHLLSIPEEYDEHIYFVDDETVNGLKTKIIEVCSKPAEELRVFGEMASRFIIKNKTPEPQMKKVLNFINTK